ncbi:hypothetical protein PHYPSEUDO_009269 [Phytophthora pseudosyringae]|uniref:RxLR effector protein n=1 Tax=Phytophthora pseudosyringae TaxID=221518 RepID=A0A8T1VDC0_9STRA|nr:hypothetical protein PHYPSEUDO_009269 [Phytophthora pseudosyringae]
MFFQRHFPIRQREESSRHLPPLKPKAMRFTFLLFVIFAALVATSEASSLRHISSTRALSTSEDKTSSEERARHMPDPFRKAVDKVEEVVDKTPKWKKVLQAIAVKLIPDTSKFDRRPVYSSGRWRTKRYWPKDDYRN